MGPLIISFLLAGKIGAYTAAELGTMRVTEQIDAIQCLGTNPIQYLIVPRFVGIVISSLILLVIGLMVSRRRRDARGLVLCGVNPLQFATSIPRFITPGRSSAGCSNRWSTARSSPACLLQRLHRLRRRARRGHSAVTLAAVYTNFYIVIANFITSEFIDWSPARDALAGRRWK